MPMDALCLSAVLRETEGAVVGGRIDKIHQPSRDEILLHIRGQGGPCRLLLSANPSRARIQLTALPRENPAEPPMFCMLLRKYLAGGKILALRQPPMERLAELVIEGTNEMGDKVPRRLILEAMGRRTNLILLDGEDRIVDCLRRTGGDLTQARPLLPGMFYQYPEAQAGKLDPRSLTQEAFQALALEGAVTCTCTQEGEALHVACAGQNAHGSTPEEGHNAQTALVALLAALPLADCPSTRAIRALHALFPHGDHRGTALGIAQADDLSGPLTLAFTMLTLNDTGCTGRFDSRTPLTATQASVQAVAEAALRAAGFAVQGDMDPPHYVPESDPFLRTLAQCYEAYTGQKGQCLAIGGGTYVHDIPGGVAFGPNMPGFVSNLHGPDEKIRVADLLTTAKIYAQVMVALCL